MTTAREGAPTNNSSRFVSSNRLFDDAVLIICDDAFPPRADSEMPLLYFARP